MGLAERRALAQFQADSYPGWKTKIDEVAGFDVAVEVEWDSLGIADYASSYAEFFPKVYFEPLVGALAAVAVDEMGRDALRAGLRKVVIRNSGEYSSPRGFSFESGALTIDHKPATNIDDGNERTTALVDLLEANL